MVIALDSRALAVAIVTEVLRDGASLRCDPTVGALVPSVSGDPPRCPVLTVLLSYSLWSQGLPLSLFYCSTTKCQSSVIKQERMMAHSLPKRKSPFL